ncbi:MAG TPA: hypothetical protein VGK32_23590 [Vicinamibacterales bacterium]
MPAIVVALFLAAHGRVHASYAQQPAAPKPGAPAWPFYLDHSWLLTPLGIDATGTRLVGFVLLGAVVAGYAVAALAVVGIAPAGWFAPVVVGASALSAVMIALFFTPWIVFGFAIDAALIVAVVAADWRPGAIG